MATGDCESMLFEAMTDVEPEQVLLLTGSADEQQIFESIVHGSAAWIDNSSQTNWPPDYYNTVDKLMMEFMRVTDYEEELGNGKVLNPVARDENKCIKKLQDFLGKRLSLFVNVNTQVHLSYSKYAKSVERTLCHHKKQIDRYRSNHPGYKLIFCLSDLSEHEHYLHDARGHILGKYCPCIDKCMMQLVKDSGADYVIWQRLYAMPNDELPALIIIDVEQLDVSKCFNVDKNVF